MGYILEMPGDHYPNAGLADGIRDIVAIQGDRKHPYIAEIEHLKHGEYNDTVLQDYYVLDVVTIRDNDYVAVKVSNDDSEHTFEPGDDIILLSLPTISAVKFY